MKQPVRVAVTGAAGAISYTILFKIAAGELLGKDQPVILQLVEIPPAMTALNGVVMELIDCAFPLVTGITTHDNPEAGFQDADVVFLIGARPRGPGMERADLLKENAKIFSVQGKALNDYASKDVRVPNGSLNTFIYIQSFFIWAYFNAIGRSHIGFYNKKFMINYFKKITRRISPIGV